MGSPFDHSMLIISGHYPDPGDFHDDSATDALPRREVALGAAGPRFRRSGRDFDALRELTLDTYVADLRAVVQALAPDPVHLCGESIGGIIAAAFAARLVRPEACGDHIRAFIAEALSAPATLRPPWPAA
jgi:pimeloyl-ACP methyl ester carboxylesterase